MIDHDKMSFTDIILSYIHLIIVVPCLLFVLVYEKGVVSCLHVYCMNYTFNSITNCRNDKEDNSLPIAQIEDDDKHANDYITNEDECKILVTRERKMKNLH